MADDISKVEEQVLEDAQEMDNTEQNSGASDRDRLFSASQKLRESGIGKTNEEEEILSDSQAAAKANELFFNIPKDAPIATNDKPVAVTAEQRHEKAQTAAEKMNERYRRGA